MSDQQNLFADPKPKTWTMAGALRTIERWKLEAERRGLVGFEAHRWATNKAWEEIEAGREVPAQRKDGEAF